MTSDVTTTSTGYPHFMGERPPRSSLGTAAGAAPALSGKRSESHRIRLAAGVAVAVLLVVTALAASRNAGDAVVREAVPLIEPEASGAPVLALLELDDTQKERVERLRAEERPRVEWLRRQLAEGEEEIRRAELASPFDAVYVNALVARQAELTAHLRGTESRLVSRIAELLSSEQRRRLSELRVEGAPRAEAPAAAIAATPSA